MGRRGQRTSCQPLDRQFALEAGRLPARPQDSRIYRCSTPECRSEPKRVDQGGFEHFGYTLPPTGDLMLVTQFGQVTETGVGVWSVQQASAA